MRGKGERPALLPQVAAGVTTGVAEILLTYPLEFTKNAMQLRGGGEAGGGRPSAAQVVARVVRREGVRGLYRGLQPWLLFAVPKCAIRFPTFNAVHSALEGSDGAGDGRSAGVAPLRNLLAGSVAGCVECVLTGVPLNTMTVRLIDDARRPQPRFRGLFHAIGVLIRAEGLRGIYRGASPLLVKMGVNQGVRFSVFGAITARVGVTEGGQARSPTMVESLAAGAAAGAVSVYVTHPLDVVKTRMMSLDAPRLYSSSLQCARMTVAEGGFAALYRGVTPRLTRVTCEVAVQFTLFHALLDVLASAHAQLT